MQKRIFIVIDLKPKQHQETQTYGRDVYTGMVAEAATYNSPLPTMVDYLALLDQHQAKLLAWGNRDNHGTTQDRLDLEDLTIDVQDAMHALKDYCELTTPDDGAMFSAAGWKINKIPTSKPVPGQITDFREMNGTSIGTGELGGRWKRPDGLTSVNVFRTPGNVITIPPAANTFWKNIRVSKFKDTGLTPGDEYTYVFQSCGLTETNNFFGVTMHAKF